MGTGIGRSYTLFPAPRMNGVENVARENELCHATGMQQFSDPPKRGRPRQFDVAQALVMAHALFASRGYDRVSLVDLTGAMGINPPSFYAAFVSKSALFARVLDGYTAMWCDEVRRAFRPGQPAAEALSDILLLAAHRFTSGQAEERGGCLILEAGQNCSDHVVCAQIRKARLALAATLYRGIARDHPEQAAALVDMMLCQLAGLSAMAREGTDRVRLYALAQAGGVAVAALFGDRTA